MLAFYSSMLKRIMHIDDLVYFMDFVFVLHLIEDLNSIIRKSIEVLSTDKPAESQLEFIQTMSKRNDEEKLIIRLFLAVLVKNLGRKEEVHRVNTVLGQHLVISWSKLFSRWSDIEDVKNT